MLFFYITLGIIILLIITFINSPKSKGIYGEFKVKLLLGKNIENERYVINDLYLVNEEKSTQIDHVLINRKGIFVIETKNYAGRIYGNENQREWTQVLNYGKVKNKLYNPILQNKSHIYALSKIIGRSDCFISIIVFPKAELMTETTTHVCHIGNVRNIIKQETEVKFTVEEMNYIYKKLLDFKINPPVTPREHVEGIRQMQKQIKMNFCPRCGKKLVYKSNMYSNFWGCSGYPKCRFIKKN